MTGGVLELAKAIQAAMRSMPVPTGSKRPSARAIYAELTNRLRPVVARQYGGPVYRRYTGCPEGPATSYSKTPGKGECPAHC